MNFKQTAVSVPMIDGSNSYVALIASTKSRVPSTLELSLTFSTQLMAQSTEQILRTAQVSD